MKMQIWIFFNEKYISGFCMKNAEWVFNKIQIRFSFENTDLVLYEKYRSGFLKQKIMNFGKKFKFDSLQIAKE